MGGVTGGYPQRLYLGAQLGNLSNQYFTLRWGVRQVLKQLSWFVNLEKSCHVLVRLGLFGVRNGTFLDLSRGMIIFTTAFGGSLRELLGATWRRP